MDQSHAPALDEIQFRRPEVLAWWQGVHSNSVHGYFKESPFLEPESKNGVMFGQAWDNPQLFEICSNRERLEQILRSRPGVEHLIVGEPQPTQDPATQGPDTGVWVIRKQDRVKRAPREDELTVLGTHFIVGENIYQAPSVYDIVGNHLLSAMTSLSKFMDEASPLPMYTPATGYTYFPPATAKSTVQAQSATSREGSMAPVAQDLAAASRASSVLGSNTTSAASTFDLRDSYTLEQSFHLMQAHGDEYMDENPLKGEPGNFVFTHTKDRLRARQAEAEAAAAKMKEREAADKSKSNTPAAFSTKSKEQTPAADGRPLPGRKGSKGDSKRRRKSKAATTPNSPTAMSSPANGATPSIS